MTSKRKLEKRKLRDKKVKQQKIKQRAALVARKAEENKERKKDERLKKLQKEMFKLDQWVDANKLERLDEATIKQLERNVEILKSLQQEFEDEQKQKSDLNQRLEDEGCKTLNDKLLKLQKDAAEKQQTEEVGVGGSADCGFTVNDVVVEEQAVS